MNERKTGLAYDPVRDEDVQIECQSKHTSTEYDAIEGEELPVLIDSDFRHDPVEGCQGSFSQIEDIDDGCPNCGYDRATVSCQTLGGIRRAKCRACGVDITDMHRDDYEPRAPTSNEERIRKGERLGKTDRKGVEVYRIHDNIYGFVDCGRSFTLTADEAVNALNIIANDLEEGDISRLNGNRIIRALIEAIPYQEDDDV